MNFIYLEKSKKKLVTGNYDGYYCPEYAELYSYRDVLFRPLGISLEHCLSWWRGEGCGNLDKRGFCRLGCPVIDNNGKAILPPKKERSELMPDVIFKKDFNPPSLIKVIFSIKPEFASLIYEGNKFYELRRTIPKNLVGGDIVIIYETEKKEFTGFFAVENIISAPISKLWEKVNIGAGVSKDIFLDYFSDKEFGYAIGIKDVNRLEEPISLKKIKDLTTFTPPQNFAYTHQGIINLLNKRFIPSPPSSFMKISDIKAKKPRYAKIKGNIIEITEKIAHTRRGKKRVAKGIIEDESGRMGI